MKKPRENEIEVSVFGPGFGECILMHLGYDEWIIVDSCINPKTKNIAAIEYFANIGVSLNSVKLIVATHWHDDHIRGLYKLLANCPNAKFVLSEAFCKDDFINLATAFNSKEDSGVSELSKIWMYLLDNKKYPLRAIGTRTLFENSNEKNDLTYKVESLSPSDAAILLSNHEISKLIPQNKTSYSQRRLKALKPNYSSIVLLITINDIEILLGSDMENSSDENIGWLAILNSRNQCKAELFKVPHHGSSTAENPLIWKNLLKKDPITVTTPFVLGNVLLPSETDISRIIANSGQAYLTAHPASKRAKTEPFADKMMKKDIKFRRLANPFYGHVQLRLNDTTQRKWDVTLYKHALKLCS